MEATREHSGKLVVHFAGQDDRNAVEALRGTLLLVPAGDRPPIEDPDEFYDSDLIGLAVRTVAGRTWARSPTSCTRRPAACWPSR